MKKEISALEIHHLLKEFEPLLDSKIDRVYQFSKEDFLFQFYKAGYGKILLRIGPKTIYITQKKEKAPEKIMGFCEFLRKKLSQARIRGIRQLGFERIIQFGLDVKEKQVKKYFLYVELFDKGNLILCDEENTVVFARIQHKWKSRTIRIKQKYEYPKKEHNFLLLKKHNIKELLQENKNSIVKTLAIQLGLGGLYAEELCMIAKIDKNKTKLSDKEINDLLEAAETLKTKEPDPRLVIKDNKKIEAIPFRMFFYKDLEQKSIDSFSAAIENMFVSEISKPVKIKEIEKVEKIIKKQEESIKLLERKTKENNIKGDLIYEHYKELEDLMNKLNELREKFEWDEVKKKLKHNKLVKEIKEKEGEMVLEL